MTEKSKSKSKEWMEQIRTWWMTLALPGEASAYMAWALVAALVFIMVMMASVIFRHEGDITKTLRVGEYFYTKPGVADLVRKSEPFVYTKEGVNIGFDGQFYYYLAHDPLLLKEATINGMDAPQLRSRRIFYPIVARLLVRHRSDIPFGLLLTLYLAAIGTALLFASELRAASLSPLWVFCGVISFCAMVATEHATGEPLGAFLIVLALWAWKRERSWLAWFATAAAILTKEQGAVLILAFGVMAVSQKKWRDLAFICSAAVPMVLWVLYLKWKVPVAGNLESMTRNFTIPYWGALRVIPDDWNRFCEGHNEGVHLTRIAARLWLLAASTVCIAIVWRHRTAVSIAAFVAGANTLVLTSGEYAPCYDYMAHFGRQTYFLPPLVFLLWVETKNRWLRWLLLAFLVISYFAIRLNIDGKFI